MADIQNLVLTENAASQVSVPSITVSCRVVDSETGVVLNDYTGANTFLFPNVLGNLTGQQRRRFWQAVITHLILMHAAQE